VRWLSKYREMAETLSAQLAEANNDLTSERQRRIAAEALVEERKAENERMAQALAHSEAAREKALNTLEGVNAKLLQAVLPQPEPVWKKPQPAEGQKPMVPLMQPKRAHQNNEADRLFIEMIKKRNEQAKLRQANELAEKDRLPGTGVVAN
jgi:hypothetical protein